MPLYEVVLLAGGTSEIRLTDERLLVGQHLKMRGLEWRVSRGERPSAEQFELRYVCELLRSPSPQRQVDESDCIELAQEQR